MSGGDRVVVIGGGAAGDAAVVALRKAGYDGQVTLVGAEPHRAYHRPHLSKRFLRSELAEDRLYLHPAEEYDQLSIDWLPDRRAVGADGRERTVRLDDGRVLHFDRLLLATGGKPRRLPNVPSLANVFVLRELDDCLALRQALGESRRILIIGAGFIGAEVAASARMLGKEVLLIELAPVPLERALGPDVGRFYAQIHRDHGVDLRTGTSATDWSQRGDRVEAVALSDGTREEVDAVLVGIGIEPRLELASELGLQTDSTGVLVDETLRAAPGIYCAGDIAAHQHPLFRRRVRVEHWQVALEQGTTTGTALAGRPEPHEAVPWFWSDQYDVNLQYLGHAPKFDQVVWRGGPEAPRFSVFYLNQGVIEAVLAVNDGRSIRFGRDLIRRRLQPDPALLADRDTDLKELL
jgi:3-phenylpropionate/trans-cinnamate dioxygenase ferredoxin reductase subunit